MSGNVNQLGAADEPLVSVGIPTYNRPESLKVALHSITQQTYKNLEIIVSDNASTDSDVTKVIEEYLIIDHRIKYIRHDSNRGAIANFKYVLEVSNGEYFMWAADDDFRETWFIQACVNTLQSNPRVAAVTAEVRYKCGEEIMPFFPQGAAFYEHKSQSKVDALSHVISNNIDNLVYSLFRKNVLLKDNQLFWEQAGMKSSNELPLMLYVSYSGGFLVLPKAGFIKSVTRDTYQYIRWEFCGGKIPSYAKLSSLRSIRDGFSYHRLAFSEIAMGLDLLDIRKLDKYILKWQVFLGFIKHFIQMIRGIKSARKFIPREFHG